jgi:ABC-type nitrate/sulfonate/bicarbonate transport system substrate-binding protein
MSWLAATFGVEKPVIGMIHLPPLPGTALYDDARGMAWIVESARRDTEALQAGGIDAGMLSPPTSFSAGQAGLRELVDLTQQDFEYYAGAVTARRSWLQNNRDTALRYLRAFNEAVQVIHTQPERAEPILGKYTKQSDSAILHASMGLLLHALSTDQRPRADALRSTLTDLAETDPAARSATPEQFVDLSYLDEALRS